MTKKIVLIDMDGPLANFDKWFYELWMETYPDLPNVKPEDRKSFYVNMDYLPEHENLVRDLYNSDHFCLHFDPVDGAIEAIQAINEIAHVFICTSPLTNSRTCFQDKRDWIANYLGLPSVRRLIITDDKTMIHGNFLIDDKPVIEGRRIPDWRQIVFDKPYNRAVTDKPRLSWTSWRAVLPPLLKQRRK